MYTQIIIYSIFRNFQLHRPSKVILGEDTTQLIHILKQFKISPDFLLRRYPDFFKMKGGKMFCYDHCFQGFIQQGEGFPPLTLHTKFIASTPQLQAPARSNFRGPKVINISCGSIPPRPTPAVCFA